MVLHLIEEEFFSHHSSRPGKNVVVFRVGMSSSTKIDNMKKIFWFLVKVIQGLEHGLPAEKMHLINFTENNKVLFELVLQWSN